MTENVLSEDSDPQAFISESLDRSAALEKKARLYSTLYHLCNLSVLWRHWHTRRSFTISKNLFFHLWNFAIPFIFLFCGFAFQSRKTKALCGMIDENTLRIKLHLQSLNLLAEKAVFYDSFPQKRVRRSP